MNTKLLMSTSAAIMGAAGIVLSFLPQEVSAYLGLKESNLILLQLLGALYFGFAALNWTARANIIGGIYSKPVALGNFAHFLIGGLALVKLETITTSAKFILPAAIVYGVFALLFGYVLFTHPASKNKDLS